MTNAEERPEGAVGDRSALKDAEGAVTAHASGRRPEDAAVAAARRMQRAHQRKAMGRRGRQKQRYVELAPSAGGPAGEELSTPAERTRNASGRLDDLYI